MQLGWSKKTEEVTLTNILSVADIVRNAGKLITGALASAPDSPHRRRDLHTASVAQ
tara:strand:- start:3019 stop:3186 length:168 start_codon:yes stop_codon:yes gene_type:complete